MLFHDEDGVELIWRTLPDGRRIQIKNTYPDITNAPKPFNIEPDWPVPFCNDYFKVSDSWTIPNAVCPHCGHEVFFYQNQYGSKVFFDSLGPPWPKHPCTSVSYVRKHKNKQQNIWVNKGWNPLFVVKSKVEIHEKGVRIVANNSKLSVNFFLKFELLNYKRFNIDYIDRLLIQGKKTKQNCIELEIHDGEHVIKFPTLVRKKLPNNIVHTVIKKDFSSENNTIELSNLRLFINDFDIKFRDSNNECHFHFNVTTKLNKRIDFNVQLAEASAQGEYHIYISNKYFGSYINKRHIKERQVFDLIEIDQDSNNSFILIKGKTSSEIKSYSIKKIKSKHLTALARIKLTSTLYINEKDWLDSNQLLDENKRPICKLKRIK